jgi:hypothetical protein
VRQRRLAAQEHAGEVDLLDPAPGVEVGVEDRVVLRRGDAGVVERDVHGAVGVLGGPEERVDLLLVGHVDLDVRREVRPAELADELVPALLGDVADDDLRPLLDEPLDGRQSDPGATSRDDGHLALDASCHVFLCFRS